ncbi:MAG: CpXC domain-containing protein [Anaerolineales bacterium]|nr:CpXC domain-containing protein [Anaerolineales bacterium]
MVTNQNQIACPNCGSPIQANIRQLIDVSQDPSAKAKLLSGTLNRVRCEVCGFESALATPLVYHDPENELLLTYMPVELNIDKQEQERLIGNLINRVMEDLPPEERKAYLLQPQSVLTMQGLVERVLETEGVTKEDIEAQRAKMRLFEDLLRSPEDQLETFIEEHDEDLDSTFFQLASLALQSTPDQNARAAAGQRLEKAIELSSFGQRLQAQEQELKEATESLRALAEDGLTREALLDLFLSAPNDERVVALVNLARPALDYSFFQLLSEKIDEADGEEAQRLTNLREQILEVTQEIDQIQQAQAERAASLLRTLIDADDLDEAIQQALPLIDDLFLGTLQANLRVAEQREDQETITRLKQIEDKIRALIEQSLPKGFQLAQKLLEAEDDQAAEALLLAEQERVDEDLLNALMGAVQQLDEAGQEEAANRLRKMHRLALKLSMKSKMSK